MWLRRLMGVIIFIHAPGDFTSTVGSSLFVCQSARPLLCVLLPLIPLPWPQLPPVLCSPGTRVGAGQRGGTAPGCIPGGTPGAWPRTEIWQCCLGAVGPSGEIGLFLEVFVAQPTVIKASMFSKGNEYFAGYCKEEFRNLGG